MSIINDRIRAVLNKQSLFIYITKQVREQLESNQIEINVGCTLDFMLTASEDPVLGHLILQDYFLVAGSAKELVYKYLIVDCQLCVPLSGSFEFFLGISNLPFSIKHNASLSLPFTISTLIEARSYLLLYHDKEYRFRAPRQLLQFSGKISGVCTKKMKEPLPVERSIYMVQIDSYWVVIPFYLLKKAKDYLRIGSQVKMVCHNVHSVAGGVGVSALDIEKSPRGEWLLYPSMSDDLSLSLQYKELITAVNTLGYWLVADDQEIPKKNVLFQLRIAFLISSSSLAITDFTPVNVLLSGSSVLFEKLLHYVQQHTSNFASVSSQTSLKPFLETCSLNGSKSHFQIEKFPIFSKASEGFLVASAVAGLRKDELEMLVSPPPQVRFSMINIQRCIRPVPEAGYQEPVVFPESKKRKGPESNIWLCGYCPVAAEIIHKSDIVVADESQDFDYERAVNSLPPTNKYFKSAKDPELHSALVKLLRSEVVSPPGLPTEASDLLRKYFIATRSKRPPSSIVSVGVLDTLVRIASAISVLMQRTEVTVVDALVSISIVENSLSCKTGMTFLTTQLITSENGDVNAFLSEVKKFSGGDDLQFLAQPTDDDYLSL